MRFDRWQIPLLVIVGLVCIGAYYHRLAECSEAVAAWVQGLGSLLAIGAALWIYAKQNQDKRADDLAETYAFVQSIHTELSTLWMGYNLNSRAKLLEDIREKGFVYHVFPMNTDALIVYNSTVARIGKVDDAALRELIVQVYARFRGFIYSLQLNNGLVNDIAQFDILYNAADREKRLDQKRNVLRDYAVQLEQRDADIEKFIKQLLPLMGQWLADHRVAR
jgi:hypothetical protein